MVTEVLAANDKTKVLQWLHIDLVCRAFRRGIRDGMSKLEILSQHGVLKADPLGCTASYCLFARKEVKRSSKVFQSRLFEYICICIVALFYLCSK